MNTWHSIRVHYHDENKDLLVTRGGKPFLRGVAPEVTAAYFTRHWRQGPHLQINVRCGEQRFVDRVLPEAHSAVGAFLAEHPSRVSLSQRDFEAQERRMAALEDRPAAPEPWAPDNTIRVAPHDSRESVLGSDGAALVTDFYTGTTEHAFAMAEDVVCGSSRTALAFDLLIATAHALSGVGIEAGFVSFRSHAEGSCPGSRKVPHDGPRGKGIRGSTGARSPTASARCWTLWTEVRTRSPRGGCGTWRRTAVGERT
ncbi:lantibiotic dehydratase C-terminal domain-containing protein [Amycolatopsis lurida]